MTGVKATMLQAGQARRKWLPAAVVPLLALTACSSGRTVETPGPASSGSTTSAGPSEDPSAAGSASVQGTTLRFRSARTTVEVTIGEDNPTVRDLLDRLPLTLTAEEFSGREKIVLIPDGLETERSPGSDPDDGDLIYFAPWGNLGFYYDASGVGYSTQTIHIGAYEASRQQLDRLEGPITITRAD